MDATFGYRWRLTPFIPGPAPVGRWKCGRRYSRGQPHLGGNCADARLRKIASLPMATPIDMGSLAQARAVVGLKIAEPDQWLAPRFHAKAVRAACASCEVLADIPSAGHGSFFSPWPADLAQDLTPMLVDPPGFARRDLAAVYEEMAGFFSRRLSAGH